MANSLTKVNSGGIKDDSIVNADIKSDAAIALSKLASTPAVLSGSTNNTICTVTGANAIQGEGNLTFDGNNLAQTIDANGEGVKLTAAGNHYVAFVGDANRSAVGTYSTSFSGKWDGTTIGSFNVVTGADNTNKDEGALELSTTASGGGEEVRMRINSAGQVLINSTDVPSQGADTLCLEAVGDGNAGITIRTGTGNTGNIFFSDGTSGSGEYAGYIYYAHGTDKLYFGMDAADRLVIGSGGDIEVKTGNVVIGTAGKGIDFGATSDASGADNELLDDYEEGTWTPGLQFGGGTTGITYSHQTGFYTKIGRLVQCGGTIILSDSGTSTGASELTGLPFTIGDNDATTSAEGGGFSTYWSAMGQNRQEHMLRGNHNTTTMSWWYNRDGGHSASDNSAQSDWTDSSSIRFILTFQT